ncbi:MAG: type II secretion system protein GspG [Polyangiaceae bacterium]|jgi:general secretion pathway protein G
MSIRRVEPKVFFPWERRRGVGSLFRRARARQALFAAGVLGTCAFLLHVEKRAADRRATRAVVTAATNAMAAWRADHDRSCPSSLSDLVASGYLPRLPRDAWGHSLRMSCPGRKDTRGFDVSSDGPDGQPAGLDRVE